MPRSRKTTGQHTGLGGSDDGIYGSQNFDYRASRPMNNDRSYGGTRYGRDNNDYGFGSSGIGTRYNPGHDDILGSRYGHRSDTGHDDILGSRYGRGRQEPFDRPGRFGSNFGGEREGHWLDRGALQRNRDYGSDDRRYSNRYGRGMYANPDERYEDEDDDIRDVRMDSTYSSNYDEIGHEGNEDIEDVDSNYDNLYKRESRDVDRSDWSGSSDRNYDIDDYRR